MPVRALSGGSCAGRSLECDTGRWTDEASFSSQVDAVFARQSPVVDDDQPVVEVDSGIQMGWGHEDYIANGNG